MHDAALLEILGIAGELPPVDGHVVAAIDLCGDAEFGKGADDGLAEDREVQRRESAGVGDEGEVEVAEVVINSAAAGETADHADPVLLHISLVDFGKGVLVFADDDGVVVLPEHEVCAVARQRVEHILLGGQIEGGVGGREVKVGEFHSV